MDNSLIYRNKFNKYDFISLGIILLLGILNIPIAFTGDQALFTTGAMQISSGEVYYRDFWDLKQPGIYLFYLAAGNLFGFNEIGIHIFELIYFLIFSVIIILSFRGKYFKNEIIVSFLPLFTIGIYYIISKDWHLTQIEGLIAFPIFLSLLFLLNFKKERYILSSFLSGFCAFLIIFFKTIYGPIALIFFLIITIDSLRSGLGIKEILLKLILPYSIAILIPTLLLTLYFYLNDALTIFFQTTFLLPPKVAMEAVTKNIFTSLLMDGVRWFGKLGFVTPVVFISIFWILKKERNLMMINLVSWFLMGIILIVLQKHGWWQYYYHILILPVGLIFAYGLDKILDYLQRRNYNYKKNIILIIIFSFPFIYLLGLKISLVYKNDFKPDYSYILNSSEFLREKGSMKGAIFVIGNPLYYYVNKREQAIPINGWSPDYIIKEQWDQLADQIIDAKPVYVITGVIDNSINLKAKKLLNFLRENYIIFDTETVYWLKLKNDDKVKHQKKKYFTIF